MKKVFAIDDDQDILKLLNVYLKKTYEFQSALNGEEALKILKSLDVLPDVILLDVEMPVMNGFEFHKLMKKEDKLKSIPVIYLTANNQFMDKVEHVTGFDFLNKPIEKDDLLFILETMFLKK